jgi:hypothetical protein
MVDQGVLPMTDTLQEYEVPRPMTKDYISKGQAWLAEHSFLHEWLWTKTIDQTTRVTMMKEYLQYSPLAISVTAWYPEVNGMYPDNGAPNTHWVMCYGMDGDSPLIFDSYAQDGSPLKKLTPDHHIEMCKRYYIGISTNQTSNFDWLSGILKAIGQGITYVINQMKSIPQPTAPQVVETPSNPVVPVQNDVPVVLDWSSPILARHSVRVICDEEGLLVKDKNDLCATVGAESGWNPNAIGKPNFDGTRDYGICQINTKYWIGTGKKFPSTDFVLTHPSECIRWMCEQWKAGHQDWWYGWKTGNYKNFYQLT